MIDQGKKNVVGVLIDAVDYEAAVQKIIQAAHAKQSLTVSALAVHGVMTGALDPQHRFRLNQFHLITPDGQPVRWALNQLYGVGLKDRVYGPTLTLKVCEQAAREQLPIYLYGSTAPVLDQLQANLCRHFPKLQIAGKQPSKFRQTTIEEQHEIARTIVDSGAAITLVGLGCPRQEVWVYEYQHLLAMPLMAVGAAFNFHAGMLSQAPSAMQRLGLEWFYRLIHEPRRLWRRYILLNPRYVYLVTLQALRLREFDTNQTTPPQQKLFG